MGKKNKKKHQHHNNNNHNHNTQYATKITEDQMCELVAEATEMHQLLNARHQKIKESKDFLYLLSTKWLKQWKQYVGYEQLFSGDEDDKKYNKKMGQKKPGRINADLVSTTDDFYEIPEQLEEYQYLNKIIKEKMYLDDDYITVTEEIWEKFTELYGEGEQIKRPIRTQKGRKPTVASLINCDVLFLNYNEEGFLDRVKVSKANKNLGDIMPNDKMQFSDLWKTKDWLDFMRKYCLVKYDTDQIKIWIAENFLGILTLSQMFVKSVKNQTFEMYLREEITEESYPDLDIDEYLKSQYVLIVEVGESMIVRAQLPDQMHGYCEECVEKKKLKFDCMCGKVHYCSKQCQVDDQDFHFKACKEAYDSQDDEDYDKQKGANIPLCGLKNLGNTCYMNSSIQLFLNLGFLFQFFTNNSYKKKHSKDEKDAQLFLKKISKTIKIMGKQKHLESIAPWSFKGQINHFLTLFQGYKQHDANDFLTGFFHTISQCLDKPKEDIHHQIFRENMAGRFNSLVICPDCGLEIKNVQEFLQIHLPIKPKTNKSLFNFVLFENSRKYIHGKCEVTATWKQIWTSLQLTESPTVVFLGKESQQQLVPVDLTESPEKILKKLKKQLLIYPQEVVTQGDQIFNISFITSRVVCGQSLRALSGYPFPYIIDGYLSVGHFWMNLIRKVYNHKKELFEQLFSDIQERYTKIVQSNRQEEEGSMQKKEEETEITQATEKEQKKQQEQAKQQKKKQRIQKKKEQQFQKLTSELEEIIQNLKVKLFLEDLKRIKNLCFYCKKKCKGCQFRPDFSQNIKDFFQHKIHETQVLVQMPEKIQTVKEKIDYADNGDTKLQQCLKLFGEPEQLDEQNAWWCSQCEDMRLAFKQIQVISFPKYLLIQLNRFKNGANGKVKNNEPIAYNQYQIFGGKKYHLESVIIHQGSIQGGHYWSINYRIDGYYIFNDERVSKTDKFSNKNAYILLYKDLELEQQTQK